MSKKHFEKAAAQIAAIGDNIMRRVLAEHFAHFFGWFNAKFDRAKFMAACNVKTGDVPIGD